MEDIKRKGFRDNPFFALDKIFYNSEKRQQIINRLSEGDNLPMLSTLPDTVESSNYFEYFKKEVDITPIKETINNYISEGFHVFGYISSVSITVSHGIRCSINNEEESEKILDDLSRKYFPELIMSGEDTLETLYQLIENDIRFNRMGRVLGVWLSWGGYKPSILYFAFNPLDKDNPDLKAIWVEVYK